MPHNLFHSFFAKKSRKNNVEYTKWIQIKCSCEKLNGILREAWHFNLSALNLNDTRKSRSLEPVYGRHDFIKNTIVYCIYFSPSNTNPFWIEHFKS